MKRVALTPQISDLLKATFGADVVPEEVPVYEAIALNTLPLRKKHPLYKGARADRSFLMEMATALATESRPVHVQHKNSETLPIGRVIFGEYVDLGAEAELRVLFTLDATEKDTIAKVEAGTVDQVSVSVLPKHLYNSISGFDYLGKGAGFETFYTGTDPKGNTIGQDGVYARMVGLDSFFEMSLVGQGGAQNARIVPRTESVFGSSFQKLAASGMDPNALVLVASIKAEDMDLTALIEQLTSAKADLSVSTGKITMADALVLSLTAEKIALQAQLTALGDPAAALALAATDKVASETSLALASATLQKVAKTLTVASGKMDVAIPTDIALLSTLIDETQTNLAAALVAGGRATAADGLSMASSLKPLGADLSAFTSRAR